MWQLHHVISLATGQRFSDLLNKLGRDVFDGANEMWLPSDPDLAASAGMSLHNGGPLGSYTAGEREALERIQDYIRDNGDSLQSVAQGQAAYDALAHGDSAFNLAPLSITGSGPAPPSPRCVTRCRGRRHTTRTRRAMSWSMARQSAGAIKCTVTGIANKVRCHRNRLGNRLVRGMIASNGGAPLYEIRLRATL